jgi:1-deoxy-D-xylulose-5-phosphate reductoisomerase
LNAVVGISGLLPTLSAARAGKKIALANKETLVAAGKIVLKEVKTSGASIIPVDSEHSAIFQCLEGCRDRKSVKKILLTASAGRFFGKAGKSFGAFPQRRPAPPQLEYGK